MTDELEEIWLLYVDDGSQSLDAVERALTRLRDQPHDREAIGLLFRSMHTFKGNSRILGLAGIEQTAHVSEDLVGIVRDEGVPIDEEIIELLIEAADVLRAMMDRAYRSRADVPANDEFDLPQRLRDKIARCRVGSAPRRDDGPAPAEPEAGGEEEVFTDALLFDAASARLADDPVYREIFLETTRLALDRMHEAAASGDNDAGQAQFLDALTEIRDMAERIAMPEWCEAARLAETDIGSGTDATMVVGRLEDLYQRWNVGAAPVGSAATAVTEAVVAEADAAVPAGVVDALRIVLDQAVEPQQDRTAATVAAGERIAIWAADGGYHGIASVCGDIPAVAAGDRRLCAIAFLLGGYLSRLEDSAEGAATRLFGEWSRARSPVLLAELSSALACPSVDWGRIVLGLEGLEPAFACCGWQTASEAINLMADLCCRVRDGELAPDDALPTLIETLVAGLRMALEERATDGGPDFASAESILTEAASAAGRMFRDPALAALEIRAGFPEVFLGSLSTESAERLRAVMDAGHKLHVVRADLGQDQSAGERLAAWLGSPERMCISSVTVFQHGSTAFDFLIATSDSPREIRAALSRIDAGTNALSLVTSLGQQDAVAHSQPNVRQPQIDPHIDANALSELVGELATARSTTRQMLASFVEADLPAQADRMLQELSGNPQILRESMSRLIAGWHDKLEQLLQVEAKVSTDLEQLSELVARIRQRPAGELLDELERWSRARADELGVTAEFTCIGRDCSIDVSHAAPLEAALRKAVDHCLLLPAEAPAAIEIHIAPGATALEAIVTNRRQANDAAVPETDADAAGTSLAGRLDELLRPVAGYASTERTQSGGPRIGIVIPRQSTMIDGMIVRVRGTKYVLPVHSIQRIVETTSGGVVTVSAQSSRTLLRVGRDEVLPVQTLGPSPPHAGAIPSDGDTAARTSEDAGSTDDGAGARLYVITCTRAGSIAVPVDELLGQESIVVRPVQGYLASLRAVTGCTLLAAGDVGMVVDPNEIVRTAA